MSSSTPGQGQGQGQGQGKKEAESPGIFSFLLSDTLGASKEPLSITIILKFFIFLLVAISLFIMATIGGATSGYSIAIILILSILTLCAFKNISNLGEVFENKNFLVFTWCFPTIMLLILSRSYVPDSIRYITDYIAGALVVLLVLNFLFTPLINALAYIFKEIVNNLSEYANIIFGAIFLVVLTIGLMYWDKVSTFSKIIGGVAILLLGIFIMNAENIIAYVTTNKISLAINAVVLTGIGLLNYILYKYTNNGLWANVAQVLTILFVLRWLYLYIFELMGFSGVSTFTGTTQAGRSTPGSFLNYLKDMNFYSESIKAFLTGTIRYFILAILLFYVWFVCYIYYKNSFEFLSTYKSLALAGFLIIGILLFILALYSLSGTKGVKSAGPYTSLIMKILLSFVGFAIVMGIVIYMLVRILKLQSLSLQMITLINFILAIGLIALVMVVFNLNMQTLNIEFSPNSQGSIGFIFSFIAKVILYIPCLFIDMANAVAEQFNIAKKQYVIMIILAIEVLLIASKFLIPVAFDKVVNYDGIVITDKVYPMEMKTRVDIPHILLSEKKRTNYGVSCWIYIHPVPDNTNEAYIENTSLVNFGGVPNILFNAQKGTLSFAVDVNDVGGAKKIFIFPNKDNMREVKVIYSRWNHVFVNFTDGNMDIFLNGDLVTSTPEVIPLNNPKSVHVGSYPGIYGEACSLVYYKKPLLAENIRIIYESLKNFNPPTTN
jgi:hypothetical protein